MVKEKVTISVRIDKDVKEQFEKVCKAIGLNISDAVNIFARKVVSEEAIPFEVKLKSDYKDTNMKVIKDRCMSPQEKYAILFPPADAESVMEFIANDMRTEKIIEDPISVGQRIVVSQFASEKEKAKSAMSVNSLDVIPVEGEEV